jgi:hypothetical protein
MTAYFWELCNCNSQLLEHQIFRKFTGINYIVILSWILVKHEHLLLFLHLFSKLTSLLTYKQISLLLYGIRKENLRILLISASAQHVQMLNVAAQASRFIHCQQTKHQMYFLTEMFYER